MTALFYGGRAAPDFERRGGDEIQRVFHDSGFVGDFWAPSGLSMSCMPCNGKRSEATILFIFICKSWQTCLDAVCIDSLQAKATGTT